MSKTTFDQSRAALEEKLSTYWSLVDERGMMQHLIAKAQAEKDSVNERIFQKVLSEYEKAMQDITNDLGPLKREIDELRQQAEDDIKQLNAAVAALEDEVSEADFRHRVGEYDTARLAEIKGRLTPKIAQATELRLELEAQLHTMDRRRPTAPDRLETPAKPHPGEIPPWQPGVPSPKPSMPAGVDAADDGDYDDPLAALSDPAPSSEIPPTAHSPAHQAAGRSRTATAAPAYPNLVIRSGTHAGKIVPLLPMTMSIGREHDNNVELKDPEVARYHARVLYENGRFHIEDLDSSTGTWVNGQSQKRRALTEGDVIKIGGTEIVVEFA